MTGPADIEADGFITCHPAQATTLPGPARMTLAEARAVRADLTSHDDRMLIESCRVIADETVSDDERESATALLAILENDD
ncbi:MAG: hypothetical protein RIA08_09930 [Roseovarius sp.]|uniref:hypothetical protein n=1 Tax=Roseovarius sp. TaxID=1486281 RepID=UPI0032EBD4CA